MDKRYADLPHTTRMFLEGLSEQGIVHLMDASSLTADLPAEARSFLRNASPETLKWLKDARPDEIKQLDEGIKLVRSSRTVGKFVKWIIISGIGAFILASQFGDAVVKIWNLFRGVGPK